MSDTIDKVSIIISKGSLEGVYPGLIMANGARMEGIEADLFFTFFGLDAITRKRQGRIKVATVGNPGMHLPTIVGALPGMSWMATKMMARKLEKLDIPPVPEFVGVKVSGQKVSRDKSHAKGWDFGAAPTQIQFFGPDCEALKSGSASSVDVTFGCSVIN